MVRARLRHPAYLGGIRYSVGVFDFPDDTKLPTTAEVVDPDEVALSVVEASYGERVAIAPAPTDVDTLRGIAQSTVEAEAKKLFDQWKAEQK